MRTEAAGDRGAAETADAYLRGREQAENFPVALRLLPSNIRPHLHNLYDVARTIDDLGDEASGDRRARLLAFRDDMDRIWSGGQPRAAVLRRLADSVHARNLSRQPFADLVEANLRDQTVTRYATYSDLLGYCELSANPVGRLVLEVFGASTPGRVALSDRICSALQVIEHCQDVAEDHRAGRVYLPQEDLDTFEIGPADFAEPVTPPRIRALVAFEAQRAEALLNSGTPLLRELHGWARLAVAGYVAGGRAAVAALRRHDWAVLPTHPPRRRQDVLRALVSLWAGAALPVRRKERRLREPDSRAGL
jgi:squalene synthase HpnC